MLEFYFKHLVISQNKGKKNNRTNQGTTTESENGKKN